MKKFKLKRKDKARWVKALRSAKYEQGTGSLEINILEPEFKTLYCCLGVACEIGLTKPDDYYHSDFVDENFLPMAEQKKLSDFNDGTDGKNKSFKWIASYIERYL